MLSVTDSSVLHGHASELCICMTRNASMHGHMNGARACMVIRMTSDPNDNSVPPAES